MLLLIFKEYFLVLILSFILIVLGLPKYGGIFLFPFAFVIFVLIIKSIKNKNKQNVIQLSIFISFFSIVLIKHISLHFKTRNMADQVSNKIIVYNLLNGTYPETLEKAFVSTDLIENIGFRYTYIGDTNKYFLSYPTTWFGSFLYMQTSDNNKWEIH